jgi:hypothetical protein
VETGCRGGQGSPRAVAPSGRKKLPLLTDIFLGLPKSFQANDGIVPWLGVF